MQATTETNRPPPSVDAQQLVASVLGTMGMDDCVARGLANPEANLANDLGMDSLDLAELSAKLEGVCGFDPFAARLPRTYRELVAAVAPRTDRDATSGRHGG